MRFTGVFMAMSIVWLPTQLSACELAIRDAKAAILKIKHVFEPYKDRCRYEDDGIQCSVKERSLSTNSSAMPGYVPGYLASLGASATEQADKNNLAKIFVDHLVDRSSDKNIKLRLVRALENGQEFKFQGDLCAVGVRTKDGMLDMFLMGLMVR